MTEKIVEVELKAKPSITVVLKTENGEARLKFKNLKQNHLSKLQIDLEKDFRVGLEAIFSAVQSVEDLVEDGEAVTVEQINKGEISQELAAAIFQGFVKVISARSDSDIDPKKESAVTDLAAA